MPTVLKNKIDLISDDFIDALNDYMDYLIFKSREKNTSEEYPQEFWSLFGAGKDLDLQIPEEAEFSEDEMRITI